MHAEFQVQKLLGSIDINDNLRDLYERTIEAIVLSHQDAWKIDKLEGIIIPDDFITGVTEFQKNSLDSVDKRSDQNCSPYSDTANLYSGNK